MKSSILIIVGLATTAFASPSAELVFDSKCAVCHIKTMPTDRANMVAPALIGVMRHVKMAYPNKDEAVKFIVDYVQNPSKDKAICMPQKIARFGLMPSQKGNITKKELQEVSEWMFDNYPPANFACNSRAQGKGGMPRGGKGMMNRPSFSMFDTDGNGVITQEEFNTFRTTRMQNRMNTQGQMQGRSGMGQRQGSGMQNRPTFVMFDANGDGVVTKKELTDFREKRQSQRSAQGMPMRNAANAPSFESMDIDANGELTQEELNTFRMNRFNKK